MEQSSAGQVGGGASESKGTDYGSPGYTGGFISEIQLHKTRQGELERTRPLEQRAGRNEAGSRASQLLGSRLKFPAPQTERFR